MNQHPKATIRSALQIAYNTLKVIELGGTWPPEVWRKRMRAIEEALEPIRTAPEKSEDAS